MGKVERGVKCSVDGCGAEAERSLSREKVSGAGLKVVGDGRRVYLCTQHYKAWKKATKKGRELDRARFA
ncbi:MAG: hypothetical protein HA494_08020 [Thaumarchaeota archaeon]|nr:hypothetical protein [Nitrososphaerota archaeon]